VAALTIAIASTIGVGVMVSSFRTTVVAWLDGALQADVYVQAPSPTLRGATSRIVPEVFESIQNLPGVTSTYSVRSIEVASSLGPTNLTAIQSGENLAERFRFKQGDPDEAVRRFTEPNEVIISEPYAYRHALRLNDTFSIATEAGNQAVTVAGVYFDYGSEQGVVLIDRRNYDRLFADRYHSGVAVYAEAGVDLENLMATIRTATAGTQQLLIRSNRDLRDYSLQVFDRTFTITYVLRLLAVFVAFVGILSALMSLQLERAREFAVLRANGMTPGQLWKLVTMQTGLMGILSGILATPLGLGLAMALIFVINRRAFGWTLQVDLSPMVFGQALILAVVASLLAGVYPAWKMSRSDAAEALRQE
jgi:putative ABC transport system permease protein